MLTSGTLPDARLSANVALKNVANVFTAPVQQISAAIPELRLTETGSPADGRLFRLINGGTNFYIQAVNDAVNAQQGVVIVNRGGSVTATGSFTENNRTAPMGYWIDMPFSAANFVAVGGGT